MTRLGIAGQAGRAPRAGAKSNRQIATPQGLLPALQTAAAYADCAFRYDVIVPPWNGFSVIAAVVCLILPLALAFGGGTTLSILRRLPLSARLLLPCWSAIPYLLVSISYRVFQIHWLVIYALLPTLLTVALWRARERDPEQLGSWLDFAVLLILGLVVEFRRFEPAWPRILASAQRMAHSCQTCDVICFDLRSGCYP